MVDEKTSSHSTMALAAIKCFSDDGTLDLGELNYLMDLAYMDDKVDEKEKRVLEDIFNRLQKYEVDDKTWERMLEIRKKYGLKGK